MGRHRTTPSLETCRLETTWKRLSRSSSAAKAYGGKVFCGYDHCVRSASRPTGAVVRLTPAQERMRDTSPRPPAGRSMSFLQPGLCAGPCVINEVLQDLRLLAPQRASQTTNDTWQHSFEIHRVFPSNHNNNINNLTCKRAQELFALKLDVSPTMYERSNRCAQ